MRSDWRLAGNLGLAASGWVTFALTLLPPEPVRAVLAFGYVLFCPGLALVGFAEQVNGGRGSRTGAADPLRRLTLALAVGTACGALVCEAYYLAHAFTLPRAAITLAAITSAGALWPEVASRLPSTRRRAGEVATAGASARSTAPASPERSSTTRAPASSGPRSSSDPAARM